MGADHNIYLPLFDPFDGLFLLGRCPETAEKLHLHRKFFHTLYKGIVMLLSKNGSRDQINHLPAFLYCLKRSS